MKLLRELRGLEIGDLLERQPAGDEVRASTEMVAVLFARTRP